MLDKIPPIVLSQLGCIFTCITKFQHKNTDEIDEESHSDREKQQRILIFQGNKINRESSLKCLSLQYYFNWKSISIVQLRIWISGNTQLFS